MIEIDLLPIVCKPASLGKQLVKTVDAFVPSRDMCGPGTLTIRARLLSKHKWEAHYVRRRWWQRAVPIPRLETGLHTNWSPHVKYNYWRTTEIAATTEFIDNDLFGDSVFVLAYQALDKQRGKSQVNCFVRKVCYLTTASGDGLTIEPSGPCEAPHCGGPPRMLKPTRQQIADARAHRLGYIDQRISHWQGRTIFNNDRRWVTPAEYQRQLAINDAESARLRRAHGR
jgi:hypothetical protein